MPDSRLDARGHAAHIRHMRLEFDPDKEAANLAKHGVDFSTVLKVFEDPQPIDLSEPATQSRGAEVLRHRPRWVWDFDREIHDSRRGAARDRCRILEKAKESL